MKLSEITDPNQRLFAEALHHMRKQGVKSIDTYTCRYKTNSGLMCAFAPAIESYDESLEASSARDLIMFKPEKLHDWARHANRDLAGLIQDAHDVSSSNPNQFLTDFEKEMRSIAEEFDSYFGLSDVYMNLEE